MSLNNEQWLTFLVLFFVLFVFTIGKSPVFRVDRTGSVIIGSVVIITAGFVTFDQAVGFVDFRTIVILFCMMLVVVNLKLAGLFEYLGQLMAAKVKTEKALLALVICSTGLMSAVAINDIICLLFTPVVLFVCSRLALDPKPHLIGVAMASNIGSAATLLGNPQNILVGSLSGLNLLGYVLKVLPVVLAGLGVTYFTLGRVYGRQFRDSLPVYQEGTAHYHKYLLGKGLVILAAIILGYMLGYDLVLLALIGAALLLITRRVKPNRLYTGVDFNLLIMFIGLFIVIGSVKHSGLLNKVLELLPAEMVGSFGFFALLTVVLSNIVSNVPAVLLLQSFVPQSEAELWWTALALLSTIAGNLTLFGSMANLIVVEIAKKQQVRISAREYFYVGCPVTVILVGLAYLWLKFLG